ncbi:MAG: pyridoxal-dependent decarboxylase [Sandaracinaceae bacterium]|nr:pyridoxal-dependent decarboxylase [Sandaracinaceae bacterium]
MWDAHKLMLVPALSTAVLFRRAEDGWLAFSQEAPYLYGDGGRRAFDLGQRTVECTKRTIGATLYAALATEGTRFFAEYVEGVVALAARFAAMVERAPDFELLARPECNIVCFRHVPRGVSEGLDALQERARSAVIARGRFFLDADAGRGPRVAADDADEPADNASAPRCAARRHPRGGCVTAAHVAARRGTAT